MKATIGYLIGLVFVVSASAEPLLEGRVQLDSGEPVADAQVRLFDLSDLRQGAIARAMTDGTGYFALPLAALASSVLPERFTLGPNYPNPFNPSTIIPYQLAASSQVRLEVFNLLGQRIATLVDGERPAGFHTATWHATDGVGRAVGAGVYIYRMTVGLESQTGRMVLIDGQAGQATGGAASVVPGVSGGGGSDRQDAQVYGLIVSGRGLAPYVDSAFRVESGMAPVELVLSAGKATQDDCPLCGFLGDDDHTIADGQGGHTAPEADETEEEEAATDSTSSEGGPDLIVQAPSVCTVTLTPEQAFTLNVTVQNQGDEQAAATTLRYYRSNNSTIAASDTEVGTGVVDSLDASATSAASIELTAPTGGGSGVYFYGACVDSVSGESNTDNNCSSAVRITVGRQVVYWTDTGTNKIQRANLDGSQVEDLVITGLVTLTGLALDVAGSKIYWTDAGTDKIQRANLDGSQVEDLVTAGLEAPASLALDVADSKIYWTDWGTAKIQRANLDGSQVEDLVTAGLDVPGDISLDVAGSKIYWTDWGTDKIQRANLDGSQVEDLVTAGLVTPFRIALDVADGKIYWTDLGTDKIQRANLDGSQVEDLVTAGLDEPYDIALDVADGKIYWTDAGTNKIQRANLDGSQVEDLVTAGLVTPFRIALGFAPVEPVEPVGFAPPDEDTFNSQMVGKSLRAGAADGFYVDFVSAGRFSEDGVLPGSYSYSNTGSNTGILTQTYDDGQYGGECALQLTFTSATTGLLSFVCDSGDSGQATWRIVEIGTPGAPTVVPRIGTNTELGAIFFDVFEAGESRAYDFQIRTLSPQGSWINSCGEFGNPDSIVLLGRIIQEFVDLESGTVYEVRYRYRNSSRCGQGTPGLWSEIGAGATSGGRTSLLRLPEDESAKMRRYYRSDHATIDAIDVMELK